MTSDPDGSRPSAELMRSSLRAAADARDAWSDASVDADATLAATDSLAQALLVRPAQLGDFCEGALLTELEEAVGSATAQQGAWRVRPLVRAVGDTAVFNDHGRRSFIRGRRGDRSLRRRGHCSVCLGQTLHYQGATTKLMWTP